VPSADKDVWNALMRGGLGMMAAASRPGANFGGSLAAGGLTGLSAYDQARRERNAAEQQRYTNELQRTQTAGSLAGQEVQAQQGAARLTLDDRRIVSEAKQSQAQLNFQAAQLRAELADHAENRASQREVAIAQRETQRLIADASGADRRAIAELSAWRERDDSTLQAAERAVDNARSTRARDMANLTNANRPTMPLSGAEEQEIRNRVFLNSPGSSQYIALRQQQIVDAKADAEARLKRAYANDPARLQQELRALDAETARRLKTVRETRPRVRQEE
jgi:hypothetical protein